MPIPERYWEITVAIAAPSTPNFNTMTKNKSNAILSIAETAKNISGVIELPIALKQEAK